MTPFLAKNGRKRDFSSFRSFLGQKVVQMLFDLNFEATFEILSAFPVYMTHFLLKLTNFEFLVPIIMLKKYKWPVRSVFLKFEIFDVRFGISVPKDIEMGGVAIALPKKW